MRRTHDRARFQKDLQPFDRGPLVAIALQNPSLESLQAGSSSVKIPSGSQPYRTKNGASSPGNCSSSEMTDWTAQKMPNATVDRVALKLEEFLPYRLNVCASLVSQALSRIYSDRYKIGAPEWRVLVTLGQFGAMTA